MTDLGKYIVTAGKAECFPLDDCHRIVARGRLVTSAGYFTNMDGEIEIYGESLTLGIGPAEGDAERVREVII